MADSIEIERRFLIHYPDTELLASLPDQSRIRQTYLLPEEGWDSCRLRCRTQKGESTYTYTRKRKVSAIGRLEEERILSRQEYEQLLQRADPACSVIEKVRCCWEYRGQLLEIDLFSFWKDRAIVEIELKDEMQEVQLPPELQLIREISHDRRYANAALARSIPWEAI